MFGAPGYLNLNEDAPLHDAGGETVFPTTDVSGPAILAQNDVSVGSTVFEQKLAKYAVTATEEISVEHNVEHELTTAPQAALGIAGVTEQDPEKLQADAAPPASVPSSAPAPTPAAPEYLNPGGTAESSVRTAAIQPKPNAEIQHLFNIGSAVEVCINDEGIKGAWYTGVVLDIKDGNAWVKVNELLADDGIKLRKRIQLTKMEFEMAETEGGKFLEDVFSLDTNLAHGFDVKKIRPVMPTPEAGTFVSWVKGDNVEVLFEEAWWEGIVSSVKGKSATIYYPGTQTTEQANIANTRHGVSLVEGKWCVNLQKAEIPQPSKEKAEQKGDGVKRLKPKTAAISSKKQGTRVSSMSAKAKVMASRAKSPRKDAAARKSVKTAKPASSVSKTVPTKSNNKKLASGRSNAARSSKAVNSQSGTKSPSLKSGKDKKQGKVANKGRSNSQPVATKQARRRSGSDIELPIVEDPPVAVTDSLDNGTLKTGSTTSHTTEKVGENKSGGTKRKTLEKAASSNSTHASTPVRSRAKKDAKAGVSLSAKSSKSPNRTGAAQKVAALIESGGGGGGSERRSQRIRRV